MDTNTQGVSLLYAAPQQAHAWVTKHAQALPATACKLRERILPHACAVWLACADGAAVAHRVACAAAARAEQFQLVLYRIPNRDVGGFSSGGAHSRTAYLSFVHDVAHSIGDTRGLIILEPDALAHAANFEAPARTERLALLRDAADALTARCKNATVYIDAGHPGWLSAASAANLLSQVGAQRFAVNISNHYSTQACMRYARQVRSTMGGNARFVVDVSRNGAGLCDDGSQSSMFNNRAARLGSPPCMLNENDEYASVGLDAYLWIKVPGESDGACKGAPPAGVFCPDAALRLVGVKYSSDGSNDENSSDDSDSDTSNEVGTKQREN